MKFKLKLCKVNDEENTWFEEYDEDTIDPEQWGKDIIEYFNDDLRPGEVARKLLEVIVLDKDSVEKHTWSKTNLVTIMKGSMPYDTQKCSLCGITGKRYGLSDTVKLDNKYKAKIYQRCDTSKEHLDKLKDRRNEN